jgi:hypothetical protein
MKYVHWKGTAIEIGAKELIGIIFKHGDNPAIVVVPKDVR